MIKSIAKARSQSPHSQSKVSTFDICNEEPNNSSTTQRDPEEHTSELQSHSDLVCRLLLEKKKKKQSKKKKKNKIQQKKTKTKKQSTA